MKERDVIMYANLICCALCVHTDVYGVAILHAGVFLILMLRESES